MLNSIISEDGYYKTALSLHKLNTLGYLEDSLLEDVLDQLFSMFINEYAGNAEAVKKFQKYLDELARGL